MSIKYVPTGFDMKLKNCYFDFAPISKLKQMYYKQKQFIGGSTLQTKQKQ